MALAIVGATVMGMLSAQPLVAALVVVLAVAGVGAAVLLRQPSLLVGIAVFSMWFDNFGAGPVRTGRVVVVLVAGLAALRMLTSDWRPPALELRAWLATAAFLMWAVVSGFWSLGLGTWAQGLFELLLGISYAAVFLLFLEDEAQLARAFKVFVWTGVPIALLSWFLYRGLQTTAKETGLENRTHGFTGNANVYAFVLMAAVPIVVIFIRRARHWPERLAYIGILGTLALALMASGSRSGLLAMGAMAMYCFVTVPGLDRRQRIRSTVSGGIFVIVGVLLAGIVNPERFSLLGFLSDAGAGRIELWNAAVRTFGLHPIQGSGIGGFRAQILDILTKVEGTLDITRNPVNRDAKDLEAHNLYLSLLLDLGIVGLVLWSVQYLTVARNLWDLRRSVWRDWAWAFGGTHLCLLITAAFGSSYNYKFSWTIIGFSGAMFLRQLQAPAATGVGTQIERAPVPSAVPEAPRPSRTRGAAPMDLRLPYPFARVLGAAVVAGAVLCGLAASLLGTTRYATSAQVMVLNLDATSDARTGVHITDGRIQTVLSLARSDPFLAEVKRQARLAEPVDELAGVIDATRPGFSSVIRIDVVTTDEAVARRVSRVLLSALDATVDQYRTGAIAVTGLDGRLISPDVAPEYRGPIYLRLWDTPRVEASAPRVGFSAVVGGVSALFLVVFGSMLAHHRHRLSSREDVAGLLGVPFVAALPRTTGRWGRGRRGRDATAYLRTAGDLLDAACPNGARRVAVTGVGDVGVRARAAASLAVALAALDDRPVVLVDLDPVRGRLTRRCGARRRRGWTDLTGPIEDLPALARDLPVAVPRRRLPRALRRLARPHADRIRLVAVGRSRSTDVEEARLVALVDALAAHATVVLQLGEVPGPLPLRGVVAGCDSSLVTVLDGWTPTERARVVSETLVAVAPQRVGYLLVEN